MSMWSDDMVDAKVSFMAANGLAHLAKARVSRAAEQPERCANHNHESQSRISNLESGIRIVNQL